MNKIIGLVGENTHDTLSIKNLLLQRYNKDLSYVQLIKCKKGSQLNNNRNTKAALKIEFERKKPVIVIFIRDADGIYTETAKINECKTWFQDISTSVSCEKIFLLNIYELEALIFADIDTFNKQYNTSIKGNRDVTYIDNPKEELKRKTKEPKKYAESRCPELFKELAIDTISKNCAYFRDFLNEFSELPGKSA